MWQLVMLNKVIPFEVNFQKPQHQESSGQHSNALRVRSVFWFNMTAVTPLVTTAPFPRRERNLGLRRWRLCHRGVPGGLNRSSQHLQSWRCFMGRPAGWMQKLTGRGRVRSPGTLHSGERWFRALAATTSEDRCTDPARQGQPLLNAQQDWMVLQGQNCPTAQP